MKVFRRDKSSCRGMTPNVSLMPAQWRSRGIRRPNTILSAEGAIDERSEKSLPRRRRVESGGEGVLEGLLDDEQEGFVVAGRKSSAEAA